MVTRDGRRLVVIGEGDQRRAVRRILCLDSEERAERQAAFEALSGLTLPGLNRITSVAVDGNRLEVTEAYVEGFSLGNVLEVAREHITVNVALAIAYDVVRGLAALHQVQPNLGHGRVDLSSVLVSALGETLVTGVEADFGAQQKDVDAVMGMVQDLLATRALAPQGGALLERLSKLKFAKASQLEAAIKLYLDRQDPAELLKKRALFTSRVIAALGGPDTLDRGVSLPALDPAQLAEFPADEREDSTVFDAVPSHLLAADTTETKPAGATLGGADVSEWEGDETPFAEIPPEAWESLEPFDQAKTGWPAESGQLDPWRVEPELDRIFDEPSIEIDIDEEPDDEAESTDASIPVRDAVHDDVRAGLMGKAGAREERSKPKHVMVGEYRVVASIGRGGMGEIYLARRMDGGRPGDLVALKVLGASDNGEDAALDMFMDEASIMAQIDHPNVLRVVDFGKAHGRYFLATEYLEGRPLVRVMIEAYAKEDGLEYSTVAAIGADAAYGLFAAHTARSRDGSPLQVVHRDVSPQNIFVTYQGLAKVIDFGVARAAERVSRTAVGLVKGKAAYMSPEQAEGKEVDARSDVFSLGICLWEMTAGKRLFKRDNDFDTLLAVQAGDIDPPTKVRGRPDAVFDHIILQALERDPDRRTASARKLAAQLVEYAAAKGHHERAGRMMDLMLRLFGEQAKREQDLIRSLEASTATEEEAASLRHVTGVSAEIEGVPADLEALDDFGSSEAPPRGSTTSVLEAVRKIKEERSGRLLGPVPEEKLEDLPTRPLSARDHRPAAGSELTGAEEEQSSVAIELDDDDFEVVGPAQRAASLPPFEQALPALDGASAGPPDPSPVSPPKPKDRAPTTLLGEKAPRRIRSASLVAGAAVSAFLLGFLMFIWRRPPPSEPTEDVGSKTSMMGLGRTGREPPSPVRTATAVAPTRMPRVETSSASFNAMLAALERHSVSVRASEGTYLIPDGVGGSVILDAEGEVTRVMADGTEGFLIASRAPLKTAVTWVGSVESGPWYGRAISVNDCPAEFAVHPSGLGIRYAGPEVMLPHGGGRLLDISLSPPAFADRIEVEPLGLALGRADVDRGAKHCQVGWWGKRVVLRRLPLGKYTLSWSGGGVSQTASLHVTPGGVTGGELVRTSSVPR